MEVFRQGKINESIDFFDQAATNRPSIMPYMWQRGLSYYYADRFQEAAQQFQTDVKVNPLDVEEIVWDIASQWRRDPQKGPRHIMSLPLGMKDRRPIMV
jgi:tetratricopeptide (TPR) repeat protein